MQKYNFSVIIPTYNRPQVLKKTLDCIERQKTDIPFEVIVVDDCSTLPLPELGFGKGKRASWKLLRNETNMGRAATRNRGIREAKGEYILMIDDDIWVSPGLLQAHYNAQKRIGGGVVVGAVPPASEVIDTVWNRYLAERYKRIQKRLEADKLDHGLFFTGNVSLPRRILEGVGAFDETFKDYSFEDTEMGYRMFKAGMPFSYAGDAVGDHLYDENLRSICDKAFQTGKSAYVFVKLHPEGARLIQYHSMTYADWKGVNIIKNAVKFILFSGRSPMVMLVKIGELIRWDSLVFKVLPWVELANMAGGVREANLEGKGSK